MGFPSRLRWQLTLSHLVAIAVTLVSMIAATIMITSTWVALQNSPAREPAQDARIVARAIGDMVLDRAAASELNGVLGALASGRLRVLVGPGPFAPEPAHRIEGFGPSLRNLSYVVVVLLDGSVLASSEAGGGAFDPPERSEWSALLGAAFAGERDPRRLVVLRSGAGPAALGAYPIVDDDGRAVAAVIVAKSALPPPDRVSNVWRGLAIFGAATVAILSAAFVFALTSATVVGYVLSRRLVARLERLGRATEALASGDLDRRVEEGAADEVGQLARRFNAMADRLVTNVTELEEQKCQAESLLQAKRDLVANVSHELRTPLAAIRGYTESLLIAPDVAGERRRESLEVIHRETEQLSRLIDDLFLLSTTEAGALRLTARPISLAEVVEEVADTLRTVARRERGVTIVASAADMPPAWADRERVVQVLANLVRNAIRHTPEGGLVAIRAERRGDHAAVTVEDTGLGIPPEQIPHLFDRFYRGDSSRDRASGGAGLGLAIVRELVVAMGGEVSVESVVGEGSRFAFTLPLAADGKGGLEAAASGEAEEAIPSQAPRRSG